MNSVIQQYQTSRLYSRSPTTKKPLCAFVQLSLVKEPKAARLQSQTKTKISDWPTDSLPIKVPEQCQNMPSMLQIQTLMLMTLFQSRCVLVEAYMRRWRFRVATQEHHTTKQIQSRRWSSHRPILQNAYSTQCRQFRFHGWSDLSDKKRDHIFREWLGADACMMKVLQQEEKKGRDVLSNNVAQCSEQTCWVQGSLEQISNRRMFFQRFKDTVASPWDSTRLLHQTSWSEDFVEHRQEKKVQTGVTTITGPQNTNQLQVLSGVVFAGSAGSKIDLNYTIQTCIRMLAKELNLLR